MEDLNLVISIQRKFSYLQSIPGVFAIQRPYLPIQHPYVIKPSTQTLESHETTSFSIYNKRQLTGVKRLFDDKTEDSPIKSINLGWNTPQNGIPGAPIWSIPPLLQMPCSLGALLAKLPSVPPFYNPIEAPNTALLDGNIDSSNRRVQVDNGGIQTSNMKLEYSSCQTDAAQEEKPISSIHHNLDQGNGLVMELGLDLQGRVKLP